jgi:hypothetical protein
MFVNHSSIAYKCRKLEPVFLMHISTYALNLDRQPDRLTAISSQLNAQGMDWERFVAIAPKLLLGLLFGNFEIRRLEFEE